MKISEHDMLVTLATMAIKMNDLTGHDVIEALRELGHKSVVTEAREQTTSEKTVADMTDREQIERLLHQRNALLKLIDQTFLLSEEIKGFTEERLDSLYDEIDEITGNTYVVEGRNPATGDTLLPKERSHVAFDPYINSGGDPWR